MSYFIITYWDGDLAIHLVTKEELKKEMSPNPDNIDDAPDIDPARVATDPKTCGRDLEMGRAEYIIIKGELVVPEKKTVVTKWDIP